MKKIAIVAAVAAVFSGAATAQGPVVSDSKFVVPYVYADGNGQSTAVGISVPNDCASASAPATVSVDVYNAQGVSIGSSSVKVKGRSFVGFVLDTKVLTGGTPMPAPGYAVVSGLDSCAGAVANAFQVNRANQDVAFVPVVKGDVGGKTDLRKQMVRFAFGGTAKSTIVIWKNAKADPTAADTTIPTQAYDSTGTSSPVTLTLGAKNVLDVIDPSKLNMTINDGFIDLSAATVSTDMVGVTFTFVMDSTFGATQTLLGFQPY